jgi:hypothetical protein
MIAQFRGFSAALSADDDAGQGERNRVTRRECRNARHDRRSVLFGDGFHASSANGSLLPPPDLWAALSQETKKLRSKKNPHSSLIAICGHPDVPPRKLQYGSSDYLHKKWNP